jgi:hypothetical protein
MNLYDLLGVEVLKFGFPFQGLLRLSGNDVAQVTGLSINILFESSNDTLETRNFVL